MNQTIWYSLIVTAQCLTLTAMAGSARLTRDQLKKFDASFAEQEKAACQTLPPEQREAWLIGELKKVDDAEPQMQPLTQEVWKVDPVDFKVGDDPIVASWVQGSPGTWGVVNGKPLKNFNDKDEKTLKGSVVAGSDLTGAFWLLEKNDQTPDLALALEAKSKNAVGVIFFEKSPRPLSEEGLTREVNATPFPLPVIHISYDEAQKLKSKMKVGTVSASLSLKTEFPVSESGKALLIKKGGRTEQVLVKTPIAECQGVGQSLAFLQWIKASEISTQGTTFVFVSSVDFLNANGEHLRKTPAQISMAAIGESPQDRAKFLNTWFKTDLNPDEALDLKAILKKAKTVNVALKGAISGEELKKYDEVVRLIDKTTKPSGRLRLIQLIDEESIAEGALRLKTLRQVHSMAERGQWDEALKALKELPDYRWADQVSASTFQDYQKLKGDTEGVGGIWAEFQKGKQNVDALLEALEKEIDRLDKKLSDNFFKLQKSIEEFQKI